MALLDILKQAFQSGGNQLAASQAGAQQGLPPLQGAFEDYGPWGAGGAPNPFAKAIMAQSPAAVFPPTPQETGRLQPPPEPAQATLSQKSPMSYNALFDPSRGGTLSTLGALMGAPTKAEYVQQRSGAANSAGIAAIQKRVESGMSPQAAIVDYIKSPEGQQWFLMSQDPMDEVRKYLANTTPPKPGVNTVGRQLVDDNGKLIYQGPEDPYTMSPGQTHINPGQETTVTAPLNPTETKQKYDEYVADETKRGNAHPMSLQEWTATNARAGASNTSATTRTGKTIPTEWIKKQVELTDGAAAAQQTIQLLDHFDSIMGTHDTGAAQAIEQPVQALLVSLGLADKDTTSKVGTYGILEGLGNNLALLARQGGFSGSDKVGLTGNTSDKDLNFLIKSVPNIWQTTLANKGLIIILRAQARRQALIQNLKADYISGDAPGQTTDGGNLSGFTTYLDKQLEAGGALDGAFLTPDEKQQLLDLNKQSASAPPREQPGTVEGGAKTTPHGERVKPAGPAPQSFMPDDPKRDEYWKFVDPEDRGKFQ